MEWCVPKFFDLAALSRFPHKNQVIVGKVIANNKIQNQHLKEEHVAETFLNSPLHVLLKSSHFQLYLDLRARISNLKFGPSVVFFPNLSLQPCHVTFSQIPNPVYAQDFMVSWLACLTNYFDVWNLICYIHSYLSNTILFPAHNRITCSIIWAFSHYRH